MVRTGIGKWMNFIIWKAVGCEGLKEMMSHFLTWAALGWWYFILKQRMHSCMSPWTRGHFRADIRSWSSLPFVSHNQGLANELHILAIQESKFGSTHDVSSNHQSSP